MPTLTNAYLGGGALIATALIATLSFLTTGAFCEESCSGLEYSRSSSPLGHDYSAVLTPERSQRLHFDNLPGFTRTTYHPDHALITPESRVFAALPGWKDSLVAHLITPASGAHFAMYLAQMGKNAVAPAPIAGVERFVLVLEGAFSAAVADGSNITLLQNDYMYIPANTSCKLKSSQGAGLLVFERVYVLQGGSPQLLHGSVDAIPLLPAPGEVFQLRKLLPQTPDYDFNVHIMDFQPGEYLNVKEVHYNQHGLLLLEGQGIYRLGEHWYPVQAGDAIWMAPFVLQWYAALGTTPSRYVLYKDVTVDPLFS